MQRTAAMIQKYQNGLIGDIPPAEHDTAQYEAALRQNLKLMFEQAQMALLSGNQKLYEHSLSKARNWLTTYFTVDEHATRAVAEAIDELEARRITVTLPDISDSRRELKAYLNNRRAQQAGSRESTP